MLGPVPMMRLRAVVLERDRRAVLCGLGRLGALELTQTPAGADTAPLAPPDRHAQLAACDGLAARMDEVRRALGIPASAGPAEPAEGDLSAVEPALCACERIAADLVARRQSLAQRRDELAAARERLAGYGDLGLPMERFRGLEFLHFVTGSLPLEGIESLQSTLAADVTLLPLPERGGRRPVIALAPRRGRPALDRVLEQAGFRPSTLLDEPASLADTARELDGVNADLEALEAEARTQAGEAAPILASLQRRVQLERQLLEADQCLPRTDATVLVSGWIPASESAVVLAQLREATGGRCSIDLAPPEDPLVDDVPVLLRPPRVLTPFAQLVEAFGLPAYRELEPTLFLAISYVLMFGMMFGDAGHGALLALAGGIAAWTGRRVGWALVFAGLASIGFGVLYGSYFGITAMKEFALWRDPLEGDPLALMALAIAFGVVLNSLGLVLNIVNRFRCRDVAGGLLDKFGAIGLVFYWGALLLLTKYAALQARGAVGAVLVAFLGLPLAAWCLREPLSHLARRHAGHPSQPGGLAAAVMESFVGAFEAVLVYMANTISFVRLAAYALSHAALLLATFLIAAQLQGVDGRVTAWSLLVIVVGNAIAIALEGLVAGVQALRLEYYEFFGKFFSGAGRPFRPFRLAGTPPAGRTGRGTRG